MPYCRCVTRDEIVGDNVRAFREAKGISQARAAELMTERGFEGFYPQTILKVEKGARALKFAEGLALAEVLGVDPTQLFPHDGTESAVRVRQQIMAAITRAARLLNEHETALASFQAAQRELDMALGGNGSKGLVTEDTHPNLRFCAKAERRLIEDLLYTSPMVLVGPGDARGEHQEEA